MSISTKATLTAIGVVALVAGAAIGYQMTRGHSFEHAAAAPTLSQQSRAVPVAPPPSVPTSPPPGEELKASFEQLAETLPASVGVAISAGEQVVSYGDWKDGAAWSTIKVPLSIAALRKDAGAAEPYISLAIAQSDNSAADQMWAMLGAPADAGAAVQAVLADGGNPGVKVQTQQVHPPYSPYGQTQWPLAQAAKFAFRLPCLQADSVLIQMKSIAPEQQWGLAGDESVAAKGGWGPESDGGYLVRQIALVETGPDSFGVAVAAKPSDGSFATGTAIVNKLSEWVLDHRDQLPKGRCTG